MSVYVLKLGGHVIMDELGRLNGNILSSYVDLISELWCKGFKLHVVVGGGALARFYITFLQGLGASKVIQDAIGIETARVNAKLLAYGLQSKGVNATFVSDVSSVKWFDDELYVLGGLSPGQSTTAVAALLAEAVNASKLIVATDVDGVYTDDPKKNPSARLLKRISVGDVANLLKLEGEPGSYKLLDGVALQVVSRSKLVVHVVNGLEPLNVRRAVEGADVGTIISSEKNTVQR
ncbi:MAG: UMP kinase [Candidatus Nezhaarchaeota archaeon]|nr:UMP kinase [Candidatus Nezhaarchaeota archaeon]